MTAGFALKMAVSWSEYAAMGVLRKRGAADDPEVHRGRSTKRSRTHRPTTTAGGAPPLGDGRFRCQTVDALVFSGPTVSLGFLPLGQRGSGQSLAHGLLQLNLPDHITICVQLEVEPHVFLVPETANPGRHGPTASKGSSCQRQPAVPSSWMCSMNSATGPPPGNVRVSALRIWV